MLGDLLREASKAFLATGHPKGEEVGRLLAMVKAPHDFGANKENISAPLQTLSDALQTGGVHPLAHVIAVLAPKLVWATSQFFGQVPDNFVGDYHFTQIIGPEGVIHDKRFRFGAYLQQPDTFYPLHSHEAEEIFFPVAGSAQW